MANLKTEDVRFALVFQKESLKPVVFSDKNLATIIRSEWLTYAMRLQGFFLENLKLNELSSLAAIMNIGYNRSRDFQVDIRSSGVFMCRSLIQAVIEAQAYEEMA